MSLGLSGWGILAHSLLALELQDLGFQRQNVLVARTDASLAGYQQGELFPLYRNIGHRLAQLPGVTSAAMAHSTPESVYSSSGNFFMGGYNPPPGLKMNAYYLSVGPGFFETLRVPVLRGRDINVRDTPNSPDVALVNQAFVDLYLPKQDPIGRHISLGSPFKAPGAEVVGVVANSRFYDPHEKSPPMIFFSLSGKNRRLVSKRYSALREPLWVWLSK